MKGIFQLTSVVALLSVSSFAQATLTTSTAAPSFTGTNSVTATANSSLSASSSNNNASVTNVSLGQFAPSLGVLTGVDLNLSSSRTQTIQGTGNKNNGPGRDANGNGSSTAALTAPGISTIFSSAISLGGSGCSLAQGPTGPISCSWGVNTSTNTATNSATSADSNHLDEYIGSGSVSAQLTLPSLTATSTLSRTQGQASSSSTTYSVNWSGDLTASYNYLQHAQASFNNETPVTSLTLDFGTVQFGADIAPISFSIHNLANANSVGLDLDAFVATGTSKSLLRLGTDLSTFTDLTQGSSINFNALLSTAEYGTFHTQYILDLSDADIGASSSRNSYQLAINLTGNVSAVPVPSAIWLFASSLLGVSGLISRRKA